MVDYGRRMDDANGRKPEEGLTIGSPRSLTAQVG